MRKTKKRPATLKRAYTAQQVYDDAAQLAIIARRLRKIATRIASFERSEEILFRASRET